MLTEIWNAFNENIRRTRSMCLLAPHLAVTSAKIQLPENDPSLLVDVIAVHLQSLIDGGHDLLGVGVDATMASVLISSWTMIEVLLEDLLDPIGVAGFTVPTDHGIQSLYGASKIYVSAFAAEIEKADRFFGLPDVLLLEAVRNVFVHHGGKIDPIFIKRRGYIADLNFPPFNEIKVGDEILLDGKIVARFVLAAEGFGRNIIRYVERRIVDKYGVA